MLSLELHRIPRRFVYMSEGIKGGLGLMWAIKPDAKSYSAVCTQASRDPGGEGSCAD